MDQRLQSSRAALDTAARILIDTSQEHLKNVPAHSLSLCCTYNIGVARKHIEGRGELVCSEDTTKGLEILRALDKLFPTRWASPQGRYRISVVRVAPFQATQGLSA